jgi:hypothetical protein
MSEPTADTRPRAPVTRAYIIDSHLAGEAITELKIVEFRSNGTVSATLGFAGISFDVMERLAVEGAIRLHLAGEAIADILSGAAIPARTPPAVKGEAGRAGKKLDNVITKAIVAVRADELYAIAKFRSVGRLSPPEIKAMRAAAETEAAAWAEALSPELRTKAARMPLVRAKRDELEGKPTSLGDLKADAPDTSPDVGAQFEAASDPIADAVSEELEQLTAGAELDTAAD